MPRETISSLRAQLDEERARSAYWRDRYNDSVAERRKADLARLEALRAATKEGFTIGYRSGYGAGASDVVFSSSPDHAKALDAVSSLSPVERNAMSTAIISAWKDLP